MKNSSLSITLAGILMLGLILSSCVPQPTSPPATSTATTVPADTAIPSLAPTTTAAPFLLPALTLKPGDFYFSLDGRPSFIFSRNVAGYQQVHYKTFLQWTSSGGSKFARIQLDSLGMGYTTTGAVDPNWLAQWDQVFATAEAHGIYILPVFSGWFDWNAGSGYSTWKSNPLNQANGGPVESPAELFQKDSATQGLWLAWMQTLVKHWQPRRNILGWEVFSELNLGSGASESAATDFVNKAVVSIHSADPSARPITASLADTGTWPDFYRNASIDFINIHPYPPSAKLDRDIISGVRNSLGTYNRPVLIGESGLNAESPENYPPKAEMGVRHALWAAIVSGAMNGRALYWEDSFGIYFPTLGMPFVQKYATEELAAASFVKDVDFSGFKPLAAAASSGIWGATVGNEDGVIGWYRDAGSEPPDWTLRPLLSKQIVTITVPGSAFNWRVDFYNTRTGTDVVSSITVTRTGGTVVIHLPDFTDDLAFKMVAEK